jgi:hypothetical protein
LIITGSAQEPMFNPNPAFLLVQKLKSAPKGIILGVKGEIEKYFLKKSINQSAPTY